MCLDREYNVITEFKNELKPENIKIFLYTMPVKDISERHSENYSIIRELKKINPNQRIVFNEYIIASFDVIQNWGEYENIPQKLENRTINLENSTEKRILNSCFGKEILPLLYWITSSRTRNARISCIIQ